MVSGALVPSIYRYRYLFSFAIHSLEPLNRIFKQALAPAKETRKKGGIWKLQVSDHQRLGNLLRIIRAEWHCKFHDLLIKRNDESRRSTIKVRGIQLDLPLVQNWRNVGLKPRFLFHYSYRESHGHGRRVIPSKRWVGVKKKRKGWAQRK